MCSCMPEVDGGSASTSVRLSVSKLVTNWCNYSEKLLLPDSTACKRWPQKELYHPRSQIQLEKNKCGQEVVDVIYYIMQR